MLSQRGIRGLEANYLHRELTTFCFIFQRVPLCFHMTDRHPRSHWIIVLLSSLPRQLYYWNLVKHLQKRVMICYLKSPTKENKFFIKEKWWWFGSSFLSTIYRCFGDAEQTWETGGKNWECCFLVTPWFQCTGKRGGWRLIRNQITLAVLFK